MRTAFVMVRCTVLAIASICVLSAAAGAEDFIDTGHTAGFSKEELTQMLAPIALYPDSLIAQILMASTYPLEVVEAERWRRVNSELKGDVLNEALRKKTWDTSIKSLCHFPDVLFALSEKLDQTRKLGDAFLNQEAEVMATIQELRRRAYDQGNLTTTKEQKILVEQEIVRIEPSDPRVVYVPIYNPLYVYGPWWYPAYPPYYWYYPSGYVFSAGYFSYGPPVFVGGYWSWAWFDWPVRRIYIDVHKTGYYHKHHVWRDRDRHYWRHDSRHRRGVAYRDGWSSERYGQRPSRIVPASPETRGYPPSRSVEPSSPSVQPRDRMGTPRLMPERETVRLAPRRDTPFQGIDNGRFERRSSERGWESRRDIQTRTPNSDRMQPMRDMRQPGVDGRQPSGASHGGRGGAFRR